MQIGYLGELEIRDGDRRIELSGRRLRALLGRLALDPNRPVSVRTLIDTLWADDETPADPANALQSLVSRLRRALGDPGVIEQVATGYRLAVAPEQVDAVMFTRRAASGHEDLARGRTDRAAQNLDAALALWRGEPLPDDTSPDGDQARIQLNDLHTRVLLDRAEAALRSGDPAEALVRAEMLAGAFPLREDIAALHLRALVALGRPAEALEAFERTRTYLRDTLGSDPSPGLRDLHLEILQLSDAPAPQRAVPTNVRAALTSFLGREDDVATLRERLATYRLVTVVGAGGSGKTRLAAEVARLASAGSGPEVHDGVWFVELASITEPENVPLAIIDALELRDLKVLETRLERVRSEARVQLIEALRSTACLIVIDNCEHIIDPAADLVAEILTRCPGVRILATSREPLAIDGEALHPLTPLPLPAVGVSPTEAQENVAVRLLLDRARAADAALQLDASTVGAICDVVRRLDGLPLAIELAAARLRVMSVHEVASRLDDRFRLLTLGRRTAISRHRTLRAVVEWSWGLLSDEERQVAEYFCLFVAGADAAAVAHVCPGFAELWRADPRAAADAAADVLLALVDKSLLVARPTPAGTRFRMLETLREFGAARLAEQGLTSEAGMAHARHYAAAAAHADRQLRTRDQAVGIRTLDTERENILTALAFLGAAGEVNAAVRLAVDLGWFWTLRDDESDAIRWFGYVLGLPGAANAELAPVAEGWVLMAGLAGVGGARDADAAAPDAKHTVSRLEAVADVYPAARLLFCLVLYFTGERDRGAEALRQTIRNDTDPWMRAAARTVLISLLENDGDVSGMRAELDELSAQWQALGDAWGISTSFSTRAQLRILDGDLGGAMSDLEKARSTIRVMGHSSDELLLLTRMADIRTRQGEYTAAKALIDQVGSWRTPAGREQLRDVLVETARSSVAIAQDDRAGMVATRARLRLLLTGPARPSEFEAHPFAIGYAVLALLGCALGDLVQARADAELAYQTGLRTADQPIMANVAVAASALAEAENCLEDAAVVLGAAARLRGSGDLTHPVTVGLRTRLGHELGEGLFERLYSSGEDLDRKGAIARADPGSFARTT